MAIPTLQDLKQRLTQITRALRPAQQTSWWPSATGLGPEVVSHVYFPGSDIPPVVLHRDALKTGSVTVTYANEEEARIAQAGRTLLAALEEIAGTIEPDCMEPDCEDCSPWRPMWNAIAEARGRPTVFAATPVDVSDLHALSDKQNRLEKAVLDYNTVLRSTYSIALRNGEETNWDAFRARVFSTLQDHHITSNEARKGVQMKEEAKYVKQSES